MQQTDSFTCSSPFLKTIIPSIFISIHATTVACNKKPACDMKSITSSCPYIFNNSIMSSSGCISMVALKPNPCCYIQLLESDIYEMTAKVYAHLQFLADFYLKGNIHR